MEELDGCTVLVSASSRTSVQLLELLCRDVWRVSPQLVEARTEAQDLAELESLPHEAVLVIGDAALLLSAGGRYPRRYDLGEEWKRWTGLPFVFAVWAARREAPTAQVATVHGALLAAREWGLAHLEVLAAEASRSTGIPLAQCAAYLSGLDYALTYGHLEGLTSFFRRLATHGVVPDGTLRFLAVA